jgi:cyanate permease
MRPRRLAEFANTLGHNVTTAEAAPRSFKVGYASLALLLLVANLRPALTSVGPLLETIRAGLGLSGAAAGLLAKPRGNMAHGAASAIRAWVRVEG